MEKVKYCPVCRKQHPVNQDKCSCGYDFIEKVQIIDATTSTNTKVIVDNTPLGLWTFIGFITLSIMGFVLFAKFKQDYPQRSKAALRGAIYALATITVVVLVYVLYLILNSFGLIV